MIRDCGIVNGTNRLRPVSARENGLKTISWVAPTNGATQISIHSPNQTMISAEQIAKFVIDETKSRPSILGSHLGDLIQKKFPEVKLKEQFGKLRGFVEQHCAGELVFVGKRGLDDIYRHTSNSGDQNEASALAETGLHIEKPTYWGVFTNPRSAWRLWMKRSSPELEVAIESPTPIEDWLELKRLGTEDHRGIATRFLEKIDTEDRGPLATILQGNEFWSIWSSQMRTLHGGRYQKMWVEFRREAISESFGAILKECGLDESVSAQVATKFEGSRQPPRMPSIPLDFYGPYTRTTPPVGQKMLQDSLLRSTAARVIAQMSEEELRGLWLPLGLISDALRGRRT